MLNQDIPDAPKYETKIKHKDGLGGAAHDRGLSFIDAALLILDNLSDDQIKKINATPNKDFPLRKQFGLEKNNKTNFELLQEYIATLGLNWASINGESKSNLKGMDLAVLERTLIKAIKQNAYLHEKKSSKKVKIELDNAENHVNWKKREALTTNIKDEKQQTISMNRTETPISTFTPDLTEEWLKITIKHQQPHWFKALPEWEQNYFIKRVEQWLKQKAEGGVQNLGDYLGPVPTTIRKYPGAPNAYVTKVELTEADGSKVTFRKVRSGVIAPAAMKGQKKKDKKENKEESRKIQEEKTQIAKQNLEQLLVVAIQEKMNEIAEHPDFENNKPIQMDLPILLQTLYTPPAQPPGGAKTNKAVMDAFARLRDELADQNEMNKFITKHGLNNDDIKFNKIELLYSNKAVNKARVVSWFHNLRSSQGKESRNTDERLADYVNKLPDTPDNKMAKDALKSYQDMNYTQNTLGSLFSTKNNAMAERAALEQIIAGKVGMRVGSCVSGKDREEMITEIAIAQQQFFLRYKRFPPPYYAKGNDKELRAKFTEMVARQYLTGHGHKLAAENSKGCDGLKNIKDVMGDSICAKIKELAPEYGIKVGFDPIKDVQKVAGFNKLSLDKLGMSIKSLAVKKKVNEKVVAFRKAFKNSEFFQQFSQDKPLPKQKTQIVPPDESQLVERKRANTIDFAFEAAKSLKKIRTHSLPSVLSIGPDIDQGKAPAIDNDKRDAIQNCKEQLNKYIEKVKLDEEPDGIKFGYNPASHVRAILEYIKDNLNDNMTKEAAEALSDAGKNIWSDKENNPLKELANALDEPKKSQRMDM
ncbi:MAG: hypothetical protein HYX61_00245 [Gammaproteobacteria bacterium]|jgi:hypothetical protein|nr:hypothetical protein [Gammaproteobacteria bacterium]